MDRFLSLLLAVAAFAGGLAHAAAGAVAISPERTSVEADASQVFAARFLTATGQPSVGEAVQFTNDACGRFPNGGFSAIAVTDSNGVASMAFTAMQPGGTVCTVVASAGAQVRFQVFTYRLSQLSIVAPVASNLSPTSPFPLPVEIHMGVYALPNVDFSARAIAASGAPSVSPSSANTGSGSTTLTVDPGGASSFDVEITVHSLVTRVPVQLAVPVSRQDLWWAGIGENGWGLTIIQHDVPGVRLFVIIYAYDDAGRPTWYAMPSGTWNATGDEFTGALYSPLGTPFYAYDASRLAMGAPVGSATIAFTAGDQATLTYQISGTRGQKLITRTLFGPAAAAPHAGLTDMWWGGVALNGWGFALVQQGASLFTMWYTYDDSGLPLWYAMPSGSWTTADTYEGRVYRAMGSPWLGHPYDASLFAPVDAGSFRLRFSGDTASFDYNVEGHAGSLPLTRTPF